MGFEHWYWSIIIDSGCVYLPLPAPAHWPSWLMTLFSCLLPTPTSPLILMSFPEGNLPCWKPWFVFPGSRSLTSPGCATSYRTGAKVAGNGAQSLLENDHILPGVFMEIFFVIYKQVTELLSDPKRALLGSSVASSGGNLSYTLFWFCDFWQVS